MARTTVAVVIGTRPEAVKLAPVAIELAEAWWARPAVIVTGQHGMVVDEVLDSFGLRPKARLADMPRGERLGALGASLLARLDDALDDLDPGAVVVQGDTASTLAGALAGFYRRVPVAHVEAGLRSHDLASPFPEEANRRLVAQVADLHLAPTTPAAVNLLNESVPASRVLITGNTVVDALRLMVDRAGPDPVGEPPLGQAPERLVVVTAHRRESWGEPLERIGRAVARLARDHPEVTVALAAHMNPAARDTLERHTRGIGNVVRCGPIPYPAFIRLLARADLVLTDSGGVQEEAASLGIPVLVTRDTTERVEGLEAGIAHLVGTEVRRIVAEAEAALAGLPARGQAARPASPYGDGHAAERVVRACGWLLGFEERPADYLPRLPAAQPH